MIIFMIKKLLCKRLQHFNTIWEHDKDIIKNNIKSLLEENDILKYEIRIAEVGIEWVVCSPGELFISIAWIDNEELNLVTKLI